MPELATRQFSHRCWRGILSLALFAGCAHAPTNPYESASMSERALFKRVGLPFPSGVKTFISQGAYGKSSHRESGNEYNWDFDVPYGTLVVAVEDGVVIDVWKPAGGVGCDPKYAAYAHNIKVEHKDGSVAQYVHVKSSVAVGQTIVRGQPIAQTSANGWLCRPQLHFGIYKSKQDLYDSPTRRTIPLFFDGTPGGIITAGQEIIVP